MEKHKFICLHVFTVFVVIEDCYLTLQMNKYIYVFTYLSLEAEIFTFLSIFILVMIDYKFCL